MMARALTIAGSDSGGGAGVQADIKTLESLGVFATSCVTAVTAQNTQGVRSIQKIDPQMVAEQIEAVLTDIGVDAIKCGMMADKSIIKTVAEKIAKYQIPTIVDPVMVAESGDRLLEKESLAMLKEDLLPQALLVTPNVQEVESLSQGKIQNVDDIINAAKSISELGPVNVLITGGHLISDRIKGSEPDRITDILLADGEIHTFEKRRIDTTNTHGTGCTLSSAITAEVAKGRSIIDAVSHAQEFIKRAIKFSLDLGSGHGPVHHLAEIRNESLRYSLLGRVREAVRTLVDEDISELIPEVASNFAASLPYAVSTSEVAGVEGRIVKTQNGIHAHTPWFGVSSHMARFLLAIREYDHSVRACMNLKLDDKTERACKEMELDIFSYARNQEPPVVKSEESGTMEWAVDLVMRKRKRAPDIVIDRGGVGKEPMIRVLGVSPEDLAAKVLGIHNRLNIEAETADNFPANSWR